MQTIAIGFLPSEIFTPDEISFIQRYASEKKIPFQLAIMHVAKMYISGTDYKIESDNLKDHGLGGRAVNALAKLGVTTPDELSKISRDQLEAMTGVGKKTIAQIMALKNTLSPSEDNEEGEAIEIYRGALEKFAAFNGTHEDVQSAGKMFMKMTGASVEDVRAILEEAAYKRDQAITYPDAIEALRLRLPIQAEQLEEIENLAKQLDTTVESVVEQDLGTMTVSDAEKLIEELSFEAEIPLETENAELNNASAEELAGQYF